MFVLRLDVTPFLIKDHSTSTVHDLRDTKEGRVNIGHLSPNLKGSALIRGGPEQLFALIVDGT